MCLGYSEIDINSYWLEPLKMRKSGVILNEFRRVIFRDYKRHQIEFFPISPDP